MSSDNSGDSEDLLHTVNMKQVTAIDYTDGVARILHSIFTP